MQHTEKILWYISHAMKEFINGKKKYEVFEYLLESILELSESEYGFIGEVYIKNDKPILKTLAITNIAWTDELKEMYELSREDGMHFDNLETLFGLVLKNNEIVISNNPAIDKRRGGNLKIPTGHPNLNSFLGVPFHANNELIGMVGIANRENGYDIELVDSLNPFFDTCSALVSNIKINNEKEEIKSETIYYQTIINNVGSVASMNNNYEWLIFNKTFCNECKYLFGCEPKKGETFHKTFRDIMPPNDFSKTLRDWNRVLKGESFSVIEKYGQTNSQKKFEITYTPIKDNNDNILGGTLMGFDVTEREKIKDIKTEFLSRMSHELRTPLNSIIGFSQLLEYEELKPKANDYNKQIIKASEFLLELVNEVLDISKIDSNNLALSIEPVEIINIISEIIDLMTPIANNKHIQIIKNDYIGINDIHLEIDLQRFKQIMINLLSNAIKYNKVNGSVIIRFKKINNNLKIEIADTGYGIQENDIKKLFFPFERLGRIDSDGSGLGLYLCKKLTELMNGTIGVTSILNDGSTFWISFPILKDKINIKRKNSVQSDDDIDNNITSILYIEDNIYNHNLIENITGMIPNVKLIQAIQGKIGLELLKKNKINILLLDLHLPDISGEELLEILNKDNSINKPYIIILSADATNTSIKRLGKLGIYKYITKPINVKMFIKEINILIEKLKNE